MAFQIYPRRLGSRIVADSLVSMAPIRSERPDWLCIAGSLRGRLFVASVFEGVLEVLQ